MPFLTVTGHRLEFQWFGEARGNPTIVMLHEGLGSVAMWKEFPQRLSDITDHRVLAYSRYGYGKSDPLREKRDPEFMHVEALKTLPELLTVLSIRSPILFGHSDGASIALIHSGAQHASVTSVIALAPHVFVEPISIDSIRAARATFINSDLRERLGRYHDDPDSAFWGWNDIWLDLRFRDWNIEEYLPHIKCPVLAIQGTEDEYGTLEQIERVVLRAPHARRKILENCGHAPHWDQSEVLLEAVSEFLEESAIR